VVAATNQNIFAIESAMNIFFWPVNGYIPNGDKFSSRKKH
jgi:hypothetical protein